MFRPLISALTFGIIEPIKTSQTTYNKQVLSEVIKNNEGYFKVNISEFNRLWEDHNKQLSDIHRHINDIESYSPEEIKKILIDFYEQENAFSHRLSRILNSK